MTPSQAARLLGLVTLDGLAAADVSKAFAHEVRQAHPDTGAADPERIKRLKKAKTVLTAYANRNANTEDCPTCDGSGKQPTRRGIPIKCSTCAGDGVIRKRSVDRG